MCITVVRSRRNIDVCAEEMRQLNRDCWCIHNVYFLRLKCSNTYKDFAFGLLNTGPSLCSAQCQLKLVDGNKTIFVVDIFSIITVDD